MQAIAEFDRGDITTDGGSLWIGGRLRIRTNPNEVTGFDPVEVWERWRNVLQFSDRYPSTALLAKHLQRNTFPDLTGLPDRGGAVAAPIDRLGRLPLPAAPVSAAEVSAVIAAHRTGNPPSTTRGASFRLSSGEDPKLILATPNPATQKLDSGYNRSGVAGRH